MLDADYHSHPALSATKIKTMATGTPRRYWSLHEDPDRKPFVPSDAMRQGSLVDCLITQPDAFAHRYVELPAHAPKRPTKAQLNAKKPSPETLDAIAFWNELESDGRELITKDWLDNAYKIVETLTLDSEIRGFLTNASQQPHFWVDSEHDVECRYMPDLESEVLLDLKKTACAHPRAFASQAYKLAYDVQLAHYSLGYADKHGKAPERCGFIVWEWSDPHDYGLIWVDDDYMAMGSDRRREGIQRILGCQATGLWPSHGESQMGPPSYAAIRGADDETELDDLGLEGL